MSNYKFTEPKNETFEVDQLYDILMNMPEVLQFAPGFKMESIGDFIDIFIVHDKKKYPLKIKFNKLTILNRICQTAEEQQKSDQEKGNKPKTFGYKNKAKISLGITKESKEEKIFAIIEKAYKEYVLKTFPDMRPKFLTRLAHTAYPEKISPRITGIELPIKQPDVKNNRPVIRLSNGYGYGASFQHLDEVLIMQEMKNEGTSVDGKKYEGLKIRLAKLRESAKYDFDNFNKTVPQGSLAFSIIVDLVGWLSTGYSKLKPRLKVLIYKPGQNQGSIIPIEDLDTSGFDLDEEVVPSISVSEHPKVETNVVTKVESNVVPTMTLDKNNITKF